MRLIRNTTQDGTCKYAIIDNRTGKRSEARVGDPDEFFVIKLKDKFSKPALEAYANAARDWDPEYAAEIDAMAARAGVDNPNCKTPD